MLHSLHQLCTAPLSWCRLVWTGRSTTNQEAFSYCSTGLIQTFALHDFFAACFSPVALAKGFRVRTRLLRMFHVCSARVCSACVQGFEFAARIPAATSYCSSSSRTVSSSPQGFLRPHRIVFCGSQNRKDSCCGNGSDFTAGQF